MAIIFCETDSIAENGQEKSSTRFPQLYDLFHSFHSLPSHSELKKGFYTGGEATGKTPEDLRAQKPRTRNTRGQEEELVTRNSNLVSIIPTPGGSLTWHLALDNGG